MALAQNTVTSEWVSPAETGAGSLVASALPEIDPVALAQCRAEALKRKLSGEVRQVFIEACVDPEGQD